MLVAALMMALWTVRFLRSKPITDLEVILLCDTHQIHKVLLALQCTFGML
jgi:hypothetical protein